MGGGGNNEKNKPIPTANQSRVLYRAFNLNCEKLHRNMGKCVGIEVIWLKTISYVFADV